MRCVKSSQHFKYFSPHKLPYISLQLFFVLHFTVFGVNFRTINGQNYSKEFFDNTSHLHISFFVYGVGKSRLTMEGSEIG